MILTDETARQKHREQFLAWMEAKDSNEFVIRAALNAYDSAALGRYTIGYRECEEGGYIFNPITALDAARCMFYAERSPPPGWEEDARVGPGGIFPPSAWSDRVGAGFDYELAGQNHAVPNQTAPAPAVSAEGVVPNGPGSKEPTQGS